jgi:hypothetical protein
MEGGDLYSHSEFKKVLSIGFEFETDDLIKFSGQDKNNVLINSDTTLTDLVKTNKVGKNNYYVKRHNDPTESYKEYVDENLNGISLKILNDNGSFPFNDMVTEKCRTVPDNIKSDDLYIFKTVDGNTYQMKYNRFGNETNCDFSNVEWVITYYTIQRDQNIILKTFFDACIHIFHNLHHLEKQKGDLYYKWSNEKIGNLFRERILYKSPNRNLFYMQSHDSEYDIHGKTIGTIHMIPQMTFRSNIIHTVDIIKTILQINPFHSKNKLEKEIHLEYETIVGLEKCIDELLTDYNNSRTFKKEQIPLDKKVGMMIRNYLLLIFYKLLVYIEDYQIYWNDENQKKKGYFKDYLSFMPRHSNKAFYNAILLLLQKYFKISAQKAYEIVIHIVYKPSILVKYIVFNDNEFAYFNEEDETDEYYGNPAFSFISYFHFLNKSNKDWLEIKEFDLYTSKYSLTNHNILVENRLFYKEIRHFARTYCHVSLNNGITMNEVKKIYTFMIDNKILTPYNVKTHSILYEKINGKTRKNKSSK